MLQWRLLLSSPLYKSLPMRGIRSLLAMVLLCTVVLLLVYSNLPAGSAHRRHVIQEQAVAVTAAPDTPMVATLQPTEFRELQAPKVAAVTKKVTKNLIYNVTVSEQFRKLFPQNNAYWSRLLHTFLRQHDQTHAVTPPVEWHRCVEADHERLKTNVHDFDAYPGMHKDFLHGLQCRDPPQVIDQPQKCASDKGDTFLLIAIKSSPANFLRRQALRETWAKEGLYPDGLRVRTVFLLGTLSDSDPDLQPLVAYEARRYRDVLQWDLQDTLFNLTLKADAFFRWTLSRCPDASFILSGDDDVFVNTHAILRYLQSLEPDAAAQAYVGQMITVASPIKDPKSKYYVPPSFYDNVYPPYAGGGGYLMSGALLGRLSRVSNLIPLFPIDDVYVGMCVHALGVGAVMHKAFQTFGVAEGDRENMCIHKQLLLVHQRTPREVKKLWKGIHNPMLTC